MTEIDMTWFFEVFYLSELLHEIINPYYYFAYYLIRNTIMTFAIQTQLEYVLLAIYTEKESS